MPSVRIDLLSREVLARHDLIEQPEASIISQLTTVIAVDFLALNPGFHISFGQRGRQGRSCRVNGFENFLFCLGFCRLNSMFDKTLGLLRLSLLPPFFQAFQHILFSLTIMLRWGLGFCGAVCPWLFWLSRLQPFPADKDSVLQRRCSSAGPTTHSPIIRQSHRMS